MTPCRIQDPEGTKRIVVSFKIAAGAITAIQRQTLKFVCFDKDRERLRIDMVVAARGKQNPYLQERRVMMIYKTHMHPNASLNPEQCTVESNAKAKNN